MKGEEKAYAAAGVDLAAAARIKGKIADLARSTYGPRVLAGVGPFGGLFDLEGLEGRVLVASADGVGTKTKIALALGKVEGLGFDLVNHCINDILTLGAEPLFFLDYIAAEKLSEDLIPKIISGIAQACREAGCALLGGETAEMPGIYLPGQLDLVGFIVGVVERERIINGSKIEEGDLILGLPSSGLHTNGYSLVRRIFGERREELERYYPELGGALGEELLRPHRLYLKILKPVLHLVKGLAHITGGGIPGNLRRILPEGLAARIEKSSWEIPPIFKLIRERGKVSEEEMFEVFNMGIGMIAVCSPKDLAEFKKLVPEALLIGEVIKAQEPKVILC